MSTLLVMVFTGSLGFFASSAAVRTGGAGGARVIGAFGMVLTLVSMGTLQGKDFGSCVTSTRGCGATAAASTTQPPPIDL